MVAQEMRGPGLLFVNSKISRPDILDEETYIKWYGEEHIPDVLKTSGVQSSLRFKNTDPKAEKPHLVLYPMEDIGYIQSQEFKKIKTHSDILPSGGPIFDFADMDARYYLWIQTYEPKGPTEPGLVKLVVPEGFDLGDKITEQDFHDWYDKEHFERLSHVPGYFRSTRYKLLGHMSHAQMRELRGLLPREKGVETETPVKFLALHEFTTDEVDMQAFISTIDTGWSRAILGNASRAENPAYYRFVQGYGDGKLFQ